MCVRHTCHSSGDMHSACLMYMHATSMLCACINACMIYNTTMNSDTNLAGYLYIIKTLDIRISL